MNKTEFTKVQMDAISLRNRNILVSASAGTGKTTVLVERIINMAMDKDNPVDLDRMLIVTFTNAASEEMKGRIRAALISELNKNPGNNRLRKQLILLGQANISTIHSFCAEVIRSNYHLLNIDPGFSVCDESTAREKLLEAINDVMSFEYDKRDRPFINLVDGYGRGNDDSKLVEVIMTLYNKARSLPGYKEWLGYISGFFKGNEADFAKTRWGVILKEETVRLLSSALSDINHAMEIIEGDSFLAGYETTLIEDKGLLNNLLVKAKSGNWNDLHSAFQKFAFPRLANAKKGADEFIKNMVKNIRGAYKKDVSLASEWFSGNSEQIFENFKHLSPIMKKLIELILCVDTEYISNKNKAGIVDYNDLEHYALECLEGEAGKLYQERFDEIFVDEYQDSNHIQENIIKSVAGRGTGENNIFMVGDIKQSIYRFRMADPGLFAGKYNSFSRDMNDGQVVIELSDNYRSRPSVLEFTNYVFSSIMTKDNGDIDYSGNVLLNPGAAFPDDSCNNYPVEINLIDTDDDNLFTSDISNDSKEAAVVGKEIINLINSGFKVTDRETNTLRNLNYGDIAILIRNVNSVSSDYTRQLSRMGIPVFSESESDFFGEREIMIMEAFFKVLDNPRQDIPLAALMRSSIYNFTDMELAYLRCGTRYDDFYDSLLSFDDDDDLKSKIGAFLEELSDYRKEAVTRPMDRLAWDMMHDSGFYFFSEKGDRPSNRKANLRSFFEIAAAYERGREKGLHGFVKYLDKLKENGIKGNRGSSRNINSVSLMSVHKSKGLEFPVVFLCACGKNFNKREFRENILFDPALGFGPDYINAEHGYKLTTTVKKCIKLKKESEDLAEEMRVLYVAMTRAREKLIITGYVRNIEKTIEKWHMKGLSKDEYGKLSTGTIKSASGYLEWILPVLTDEYIKSQFEKGIRELVGSKKNPDYKIKLYEPTAVFEIMNETAEIHKQDGGKIESIDYQTAKERFSWEYPYSHESVFHKKISVTELKKMRDRTPGEKDIFEHTFIENPDFMNKSEQDGAAYGTMLHNVIAAADLRRIFEPGYILGLCEKAGVKKDKSAEGTEMIMNFFKSPLGDRLINNPGHREKAFMMPIPTESVYPEAIGKVDSSHTTLVQGVIDSMFYEEDGVVIIDYKTDRVLPGNEENHAYKYKNQLDLYGKAVEHLTGRRVKEKYICFLRINRQILMT